MNLLVIDGQGGQLGSQIMKAIRNKYNDAYIMAVGTNATATASMIKAGANQGATGENPVIVASRNFANFDKIIGGYSPIIVEKKKGDSIEFVECARKVISHIK